MVTFDEHLTEFRRRLLCFTCLITQRSGADVGKTVSDVPGFSDFLHFDSHSATVTPLFPIPWNLNSFASLGILDI